jgi:hypothetical protein
MKVWPNWFSVRRLEHGAGNMEFLFYLYALCPMLYAINEVLALV